MSYHRARKKSVVEYHPTALMETIADRVEDSDEDSTTRSEKQLKEIERIFAVLPNDQRICMRLFYLKKLSYYKIEKKTGYSQKQIKSSLQNGRKYLRKSLNQ